MCRARSIRRRAVTSMRAAPTRWRAAAMMYRNCARCCPATGPPAISTMEACNSRWRKQGRHRMYLQNTITRRNALGFAIAMGGIAMSGRVASEPSPRIEQLAPELEKIISSSEPIQHLADGFGGAQGPAEGPLWWKESGYLLFSDIHNNKRMKYEPGAGVSVFLEPTNRANGLTRDLQGRLLACEHDTRRATRLELDGSLTVLANSFQGRQLNRPNDGVVRSDGCLYFTDPWTNPNPPNQWDLTFSGVYRLTPDLGTLSLLVEDFVIPNGLAFSPDDKILYINASH